MISGRKKNFCNGKKKTGKGARRLGIQKNRLFKRFTIISSLFSLLVGAVPLGAALFVQPVYALPPTLLKAKTMAELIFTLAAGAGTGLSGPVAVPGIYNAYGGPSYSIESMIENDIINLEGEPDATTQEIIDAIGHQDRLFNIDVQGYRDLMSTDWQIMVDSGMDVALRFDDLWSTHGQYDAIDNLGAILKDVLEIGYVQGEMSIVNLANPETVAQVAIQNIGTALKGEYRSSIISGGTATFSDLNATTVRNFNESLRKYGARIGYKKISNNVSVYNAFFDPLHCVAVGVKNSPGYYIVNVYNVTSNNDTISYSNSYFRDTALNANQFVNVGMYENDETYQVFGVVRLFDTQAEVDAYLNDIKQGNIEKPVPFSPDLINQENGFVDAVKSNPSPLIENDGIDLVDADDYMDMVDQVQEDNENALEIYNLFLDPYLYNIGDPEPEVPIPLPTYAPVRPVEPEQPTLPDKDEVTSEDQEKALTYATPGLEEVFPFCIPFDVWKMLRTLTAEREAPVFEFPLVIESQGINETVTVDLSLFDTVATILRILELILFTVGLAIATRRLIGA